jgi:hypothetical protein
MAESARAGAGRHSAKKRNGQRYMHFSNTDTTFIDKILPSSRRSLSQSQDIQPSKPELENLAKSLNIPVQAVEHLKALQSCDVGQFRTGLALGREFKLGHFDALSRFPEGKLLRLWECMTSNNGKTGLKENSVYHELTLMIQKQNYHPIDHPTHLQIHHSVEIPSHRATFPIHVVPSLLLTPQTRVGPIIQLTKIEQSVQLSYHYRCINHCCALRFSITVLAARLKDLGSERKAG